MFYGNADVTDFCHWIYIYYINLWYRYNTWYLYIIRLERNDPSGFRLLIIYNVRPLKK